MHLASFELFTKRFADLGHLHLQVLHCLGQIGHFLQILSGNVQILKELINITGLQRPQCLFDIRHFQPRLLGHPDQVGQGLG